MSDLPLETQINQDDLFKEVDQILSITDLTEKSAKIEGFIEKRKSQLSQAPTILSAGLISTITEFIGDRSILRPNILYDGIQLDDDSIYNLFFEQLLIYKTQSAFRHQETRHLVPHALLRTIGLYFGNFNNWGDTSNARQKFYLNMSLRDTEAISIREFKGLGIAECSEKASESHNVLKILGYECELVFTGELIQGDDSILHAYNVIKISGNNIILDNTNPVVVYDAHGKAVSFRPALYPLDSDQADNLYRHKDCRVKHLDYVQSGTTLLPREPYFRIYRR